ncbi:hypothetical protein EON65_34880 [archaeon]|nr:MAG: hypothetical protein EON65_34880 [archaeon]
MPFDPAPRRTEAGKLVCLDKYMHIYIVFLLLIFSLNLLYVRVVDEKNDRKSLDRRLDDSLFLVVKRNRTDHFWQFPQGKLLNEETMRDVSCSCYCFHATLLQPRYGCVLHIFLYVTRLQNVC